jgi:hypothetical protein
MSSKCPSEELKERVGDVPISTHTRFLGVDIVVPQLHHRCEMNDVEYPLGGRGEVEVSAVGSDRRLRAADRRYIAKWARRNLFKGHGGQTDE